jgi:hypothetical protein
MKEIIIWSILSGTLFISFLALLLIGIFRKNRVKIISSLFILFIALGTSFWTAYMAVNKSYFKVAETLKPRTGEEIYSSLFGKSESDCVKILKYQDQIVPKIDYAIWLEFETCPKEMKRILNQHNFIASKVAKTEVEQNGPSENNQWFKPQTLGDSLLVFVYKKDDFGNGQTIYSSLDSTHVFCIDVLD